MASTTDVPSTSTPQVKFETSPAESFLSTPGESYPSLFDNAQSSSNVMTPPPEGEGETPGPDDDEGTPAPESGDKKQPKKRKSWGQVLPEPKTNLPPRKRAKTEDEKEQRRVERVLRNRRAAQSSRERKRQEVELLEQRCKQLEEALSHRDKALEMMMDEMNKLRGNASQSPSPLNPLEPAPYALTQPLYPEGEKSDLIEDFVLMPNANDTVDPASLSPEMVPADPTENNETAKAVPSAAPSADETSPDVTQHPAAVLCDLQCQSREASRQTWAASRTTFQPALSLYLQLQTLLMVSSAMISVCLHPLNGIHGTLKTNSALEATPSILSTIIWLVTRPPSFTRSTSGNSSEPTTPVQPTARLPETMRSTTSPNPPSASSTLRIRSLRKLLTSSSSLARPLSDATMELLRLVISEGRDDQVEELASGSPGFMGDHSRTEQTWPDGTSLPSKEVLLALLWAIRVEERKLLISSSSSEEHLTGSSHSSVPRPESSGVLHPVKTPSVKQQNIVH